VILGRTEIANKLSGRQTQRSLQWYEGLRLRTGVGPIAIPTIEAVKFSIENYSLVDIGNSMHFPISAKENLVTLKHLLPFCAAPMLLLAIGCGYYIPIASNEATTIYVTQNGPASEGSSVLEFAANGQGDVTPTNSLTVPIQTTYAALALDTAGNLYVSASSTTSPPLYEILVYAPGVTNSATPTNSITGLSAPASSIAVDATGAVYALTGDSISVFAPAANGEATPSRHISGSLTQLNSGSLTQLNSSSLTQLNSPSAIAVDAAHNIYVANTNGNDVLVFSSTATGNVAPTSILAGTSTQISAPTGVAVDSVGDIFVASYNQPSKTSLALEFAPGATGNVAPTANLTSLTSDTITGMTVDSADFLFIEVNTGTQLQVDVISPAEWGTAYLQQTITSSAWTYSQPGQLAVQ
jgi:hypothetical protein